MRSPHLCGGGTGLGTRERNAVVTVGCVGLLDEGRGKRGRERRKGKRRRKNMNIRENLGVPETLQQRYPALPRSTPSRNSQPCCIQS